MPPVLYLHDTFLVRRMLMPVKIVTVTTLSRGYQVNCKDCKDWKEVVYKVKANADAAMLGHRMIKHRYISWQRMYKSA